MRKLPVFWSVAKPARPGAGSSSCGGPHRGFSLLELILASSLFLLLTSAFLTILFQTLDRRRVIDERQTVLERFVIFKEHCNRRVRNSRIDITDSHSQQLAYTPPEQASTSVGLLNKVGDNEMTVWDDSAQRRLLVTSDGRTSALYDDVYRREADASWQQVGRTQMWDLGPGGKMEFFVDDLPLLRIEINLELQREQGVVPWRQTLTLMIDNFR